MCDWTPLPGALPHWGEEVLVTLGRALRTEREVRVGFIIAVAGSPQWIVGNAALNPTETVLAWAPRPEPFRG